MNSSQIKRRPFRIALLILLGALIYFRANFGSPPELSAPVAPTSDRAPELLPAITRNPLPPAIEHESREVVAGLPADPYEELRVHGVLDTFIDSSAYFEQVGVAASEEQ